MSNIVAILVTYNRLEKLRITLEHLMNQTVKPSRIIVVNNCSNDGTEVFLDEWKNIDDSINKNVYHMSTNLGGAGGFATAFQKALEFEFDYLYVSDDDAYLDKEGFENFEMFISKKMENVGAVCGKVIENDKIAFLHRRRIKLGLFSFKEYPVSLKEYEEEYFKIDLYSFVGTFISKEAVLNCGIPNKDYFIWYDDTEHSARLSRKYNIYCVPEIIINHDCAQAIKSVTWKNYYGYRNKLNMIKNNFNKKYYKCFRLLLRLSCLRDLFGKTKKIKIKLDSLKDDKRNIMGISEKYKPGAKI
jgi:GT2 family glycosyltransferase